MPTEISTLGINSSTINSYKFKRAFSIAAYTFVILWGIYGLCIQINEIFIKYPGLFTAILQSQNHELYLLLLQQLFFISLTNFVTSAYGLAMLIKPSNLIKTLNLVIIATLITLTFYFNQHYRVTPEILRQLPFPIS